MPDLTENQGHYLVFWWHQVALGHLFLEAGTPLKPEEYEQEVMAAVAPALAQYARSLNIEGEWRKKVRDEKEWALWMDNLMAEYTTFPIPESVEVSVVICTRNRSSQLQRCLEMLQALECTPTEIIVIDNAPEDTSTFDVARQVDGVTYVKEPRPGLDIARNTGIHQARCPVVAFVDDDVVVHPQWVFHIWETFQDPEIAAMTGLVIAKELMTEAQVIFEKHWSFNRGYQSKRFDTRFFQDNIAFGPPVWEIGAGANMAFRKEIFEKTGYFDEILDVGAAGCNGDSEMWHRILAHGLVIRYNPRAIVFHEHRRDLQSLRRQIYFYMRGFITAALLQQHRHSNYNRLLHREFPKYYLQLAIKCFPKYQSRGRTIIAEIKGILSGYAFYFRNRKRSTKYPLPLVAHRNLQEVKN
ncbi:glycosyltransferase family 2 protein [Rufibacter glacialis]|nr:glycosyltransferase [Rufibacter glacialis]